MITEPRVLYLDEPTSGLDATASFEVMSLISKVARQQNVSRTNIDVVGKAY